MTARTSPKPTPGEIASRMKALADSARAQHHTYAVIGLELFDSLREALEEVTSLTPRRIRHRKRGTTYHVVGEAEVQVSKPTISANGRVLTEGDKLMVYRADEDGKLWVRFPDEFELTRFEEIT